MPPFTPCMKFSKFGVFLSILVNSAWSLLWWSMREYSLKHTQMTNTLDTKIISYNYISYYGELNFIGNFTVDIGMLLIITDFQQCAWL